MQHYRVNKLASPAGEVVKKKDILAPDDHAAVRRAADDPDCPVCEIWQAGKKVGAIE
jgi:hypothetical protein